MKDLLGAHVSIAGGLHRAFERGKRSDCSVIQIFTSSNMSWHVREPSEPGVEAFRKVRELSSIRMVVAHDSYLVNVCSRDAEIVERSVSALAVELKRCERLGLDRLVMHPGAHTGRGLQAGLKAATRGIDAAIGRSGTEKVRILLETTAGSGTVIGYRFEQLAEIIGMSRYGERLGVCLDTAHTFAAGYELRDEKGYEETIGELEREVGTKRVGCFHLNDSKSELGSRVDRHEQIGRGKVGLEAFRLLLNDERFAGVPKVIETPKGTYRRRSWDRINLATLRSLVGQKEEV